MSYCITMRPYYNSCLQTYQNILCINAIPPGALAKWIRPFPKSRTPHVGSPCGEGYAILRFVGYPNPQGGAWLTPNQLPDLILFLTQHGYSVDTSLTKMMNTSPVRIGNDQEIVCFFHYLS